MHTSTASSSLVVQGYGPAERMQMIQSEKRGLAKENRKLANENQMLRHTMKARATSMVNARHRNSKYPQHDRQKYDEILEKVHNDKALRMFEGTTMKDLNGNLRKNDAALSKNIHRIKKLDGEYSKNFMHDMKNESQGVWQYFNQTFNDGFGVSTCNHEGSHIEASISKVQANDKKDKEQMDREEREAREAKERKERDAKDRDAKERQEREARDRQEREAKDRQEREAKEKAEKDKKAREDRERKEKEEVDRKQREEDEKRKQQQKPKPAMPAEDDGEF